MEKKVLNFKEACVFLGFSRGYLYKLTSGGTIPYSKPNGKTIYFDREKLEAWMLQNECSPKTKEYVKPI